MLNLLDASTMQDFTRAMVEARLRNGIHESQLKEMLDSLNQADQDAVQWVLDSEITDEGIRVYFITEDIEWP